MFILNFVEVYLLFFCWLILFRAQKRIFSDLLRRKEESEIETGGAPPQNAPFHRADNSLVTASVQGSLGFSAAVRQMRRFCGPHGGVARQDILATTDMGMDSNDGNHAARVTYGKAKKREAGQSRGDEKGGW